MHYCIGIVAGVTTQSQLKGHILWSENVRIDFGLNRQFKCTRSLIFSLYSGVKVWSEAIFKRDWLHVTLWNGNCFQWNWTSCCTAFVEQQESSKCWNFWKYQGSNRRIQNCINYSIIAIFLIGYLCTICAIFRL